MTYKDKASYDTTPPCTACLHIKIHSYIRMYICMHARIHVSHRHRHRHRHRHSHRQTHTINTCIEKHTHSHTQDLLRSSDREERWNLLRAASACRCKNCFQAVFLPVHIHTCINIFIYTCFPRLSCGPTVSGPNTVAMCTYIYAYVHILFTYTYVYIHIYQLLQIRVFARLCINTHKHTRTCTRTYAHTEHEWTMAYIATTPWLCLSCTHRICMYVNV